jgi:phage gpG-like protein
MAGTRFQVTLYGERLMARKILRVVERAEDLRPAWPAVAQRASREFESQFSRQGSPHWADLKPGTVRRRIVEGFPPGPILTKSGDLRASYADLAHDDHHDSVDLKPTWKGRASLYGKTHQFGLASKNIAARSLRLPRRAQRDIVAIVRVHVLRERRL